MPASWFEMTITFSGAKKRLSDGLVRRPGHPMFIRLKGGKFHHFQGGGLVVPVPDMGKNMKRTQCCCCKSKSKVSWKGRFEFDGDISTGFVPIILVEIGEDMRRNSEFHGICHDF